MTLEKPSDIVLLYHTCPVCNKGFSKVGSKRFCCANCRQKYFYHRYKNENEITYHKRNRRSKLLGRYKHGIRTQLTGGVSSNGKQYVATICVNGVCKTKRYSIKKLGEKGARLAAALQRLAWVIELGVWNPKDGDPFQILSYSEMFKGNNEYDDAVLDRKEMSSPHFFEYERQ